MDYKLTFTCEALVDQNRYIGSDPVGYRCTGRAVHELDSGHLICQECSEIFISNSQRLSFCAPLGKKGQVELSRFALDQLKNSHWPVPQKFQPSQAFKDSALERHQLQSRHLRRRNKWAANE